MQIASKDVAGLDLEEIARNRFGLLVADRFDGVFDPDSPKRRTEKQGGENEERAAKAFHPRGP
jgi:hypothetical protein